ncbi:MAG: hypothetical protein J6S76_07640, partial [Clostridia bacterium]|nr:hypothetical protein [Clostridia bacterium]
FYFLWCGEHGRHRPYNISEIVDSDPLVGYHPDSPALGEIGTYHHWGEPFYGYYYSEDEWVIRRHMMLFCDAGIDFLYFDVTNSYIYEKNVLILMRVLQEYHDAGYRIPKIVFYTAINSKDTVQRIYDTIYRPRLYPDTWFYYNGKPLIIGYKEEYPEEIQSFFCVKRTQWAYEPLTPDGWPWLDDFKPQRVFCNSEGEPEAINCSVAQLPQFSFGDSVLYGETANFGRSYHNGANDPDPHAYLHGYNIGEMYEWAIEADAPVVLITGWNEWIAGRWPGTEERPVKFVDCANQEFSRDIEMMRGGYFDNYYLQMIDFIRRFKGQPALKPAKTATWHHVPGGNLHRDSEGSGTHYVNKTGRNALRTLTVESTADAWKVTVTAHAPLSEERSGSFIQLFWREPETDGAAYTARIRKDNTSADIYLLTGGDDYSVRKPLAEAHIEIGEDSVIYYLPRTEKNVLWFKACDSTYEIVSPENFYDKGDALPAGRLWALMHGAK